jgi:hypothetical protein
MTEAQFSHFLGRMEAMLETLIRQMERTANQSERTAAEAERMASMLEQQVRMIDEDRKDTASFRGRTREQLLELIEKNNVTIANIARIAPTVGELQQDKQDRIIADATAAGEQRGAARVRALGLSIAGGIGAFLMWAISEALKFLHITPPPPHH